MGLFDGFATRMATAQPVLPPDDFQRPQWADPSLVAAPPPRKRGGLFGSLGSAMDLSKPNLFTFLMRGTDGLDRARGIQEDRRQQEALQQLSATMDPQLQRLMAVAPQTALARAFPAPDYKTVGDALVQTSGPGVSAPTEVYRAPAKRQVFNTGESVGTIDPVTGDAKVSYRDPQKKKGGGLTVDESGNVIVGEDGPLDALTINRYALASNRITNVMQKNAAFKAVISGAPYLDRIEAAVQHPGSVGDQELLDAFTQLNNGGGRVTEAQVHLITNNQSLADWANKIQNKLRNGGALSTQQRNEIVKLAQTVYANYQRSYKPMYDQASKQLQAAGIPRQFWTIPDPEFLTRNAADTGGHGATPAAPPAGSPDGPPRIKNAAEYQALPPGPYIDPNGVPRIKR